MNFSLPILAPSILAADYTKLGEQINKAVDGGAKWIHCDIMDGHFVPNISYGADVVRAAARSSDAFLDVHLMIEDPDKFADSFIDAGADQITVHCESSIHLHRSIQYIKNRGVMAGVAVNPATSLTAIEPILEYVDLVLIMSVNPGFGGQKFIEATHGRLKEMVQIREEKNYHFLIEVDGGVTEDNIKQIVRSGADVLVAGSSVFKTENISQTVKKLVHKAQEAGKRIA